MEELRKVLDKAIQSIEKTTELFYQQKKDEAYRELEGTLAVLANALEVLFVSQSDILNKSGQELIPFLIMAMKTLEDKDGVLLADILQYEIKERLEKIELVTLQ